MIFKYTNMAPTLACFSNTCGIRNLGPICAGRTSPVEEFQTFG